VNTIEALCEYVNSNAKVKTETRTREHIQYLIFLTACADSQENGKMNKLSTQNLDLIPSPTELKQICKSISALEAIISPAWSNRYYSYQKNWSETEEFCEMGDGSGDQMLILFKSNNIAINGFAHESTMIGQEEILLNVPTVFHDFIFGEPVKSIGTSFCILQTESDTEWQIGNIQFSTDNYKDGSEELLQLLDGKPFTYKNWAEEYYEREIKLNLVERIYNGELITREVVAQLNPELDDFEKLKLDLNEIGYEYEL